MVNFLMSELLCVACFASCSRGGKVGPASGLSVSAVSTGFPRPVVGFGTARFCKSPIIQSVA